MINTMTELANVSIQTLITTNTGLCYKTIHIGSLTMDHVFFLLIYRHVLPLLHHGRLSFIGAAQETGLFVPMKHLHVCILIYLKT